MTSERATGAAPSVAELSLAEYNRRRAWLRREVAARRLALAAAEAKLRPWAAIALRAGADPDPALAEWIEDYRRANLSDSAARACTADDLCAALAASSSEAIGPRAFMLEALAAARDLALEAVPAPGDPAFPRKSQAAQDLQVLAAHLGARPYLPTREKEAA